MNEGQALAIIALRWFPEKMQRIYAARTPPPWGQGTGGDGWQSVLGLVLDEIGNRGRDDVITISVRKAIDKGQEIEHCSENDDVADFLSAVRLFELLARDLLAKSFSRRELRWRPRHGYLPWGLSRDLILRLGDYLSIWDDFPPAMALRLIA